MHHSGFGIYVVIAIFYLIVWGGAIYAVQKTKHLRVPQRKSKYSPFSRKMQYAVSLLHLTGDRYQWVKIQVDNSHSPKRYHATRRLEEADEQIKLARQNLADDKLQESNQACESALKLIDEAEKEIAG